VKKYIIITICLLTIAGAVHAQQKRTLLKFSSINSLGLLNGQAQSAFTLQTINGVKYKTWFAGLGVSIDPYGYRSIPVFADIRKTFGNKAWQPFLYADAGVGLPIKTDYFSDKNWWPGSIIHYNLQKPFYGEWGIGINRAINKSANFIFAIGYSYKNFSYTETQSMGDFPILNPISNKYDFYYKRVAVKMGLQF